jgi:hypothetical protein
MGPLAGDIPGQQLLAPLIVRPTSCINISVGPSTPQAASAGKALVLNTTDKPAAKKVRGRAKIKSAKKAPAANGLGAAIKVEARVCAFRLGLALRPVLLLAGLHLLLLLR